MKITDKNFHNSCLICSNTSLKSLERYKSAYLTKCKKCKLIFSKKIPSKQELIDHYDGYGRNDYLSPLTIQRYNELLDKFEKFRKNGKIIDVGCGIGYFLEVAKKRGWEVYGTEYTNKAIKICEKKGIKMQKGKLNPENYFLEGFDVITSFEVIEHINNPIEEISNFYKILRKGGLIYLTTPNFNSISRYYLKSNYNVITYPEHLSYYTPKTIKYLFRKSNFKALEIQTTGISITRIKTSKGLSNQAFISEKSDDEILRNKIEKNFILKVFKSIVNFILTLLGKGNSLKGWFIKI